jgi:hypothetical protein
LASRLADSQHRRESLRTSALRRGVQLLALTSGVRDLEALAAHAQRVRIERV